MWEQAPLVKGTYPSDVNRAKFLYIHDAEVEVTVRNTSFDCGGELNETLIFSLNQDLEAGDAPLFAVTVAPSPCQDGAYDLYCTRLQFT